MDDALIDFIVDKVMSSRSGYELAYSRIFYCNCCYEISPVDELELRSLIKEAVKEFEETKMGV